MDELQDRGTGGESWEEEPSQDKAEPPSHPVFCPPVLPLTDEQQAKIAELKQRVKSIMIPFFSDEHTYTRFLGARNWDVDRAEAMLRDAIEWRKGLEPIGPYRDLVSLSMAVELSVVMSGKGESRTKGFFAYLTLADKFGRTVMYFCPRRHNPKQREVDSALRVMVWFMDMLWRATKDTHYKKFVVLFNMKGDLKNPLIVHVSFSRFHVA